MFTINEKDRAIIKLKKLMVLAERASNENEASNAFSKARAFMKKHNIFLSEIYSPISNDNEQQRREEQQIIEEQRKLWENEEYIKTDSNKDKYSDLDDAFTSYRKSIENKIETRNERVKLIPSIILSTLLLTLFIYVGFIA
ncbi:DUF2786 domain-containing protein [Proteus terrae]|uniref:DUF2786 domain-containing protein n=2 Tax=Proteus terrae TaxID=1574161 RepID=UPI0028720F8F|nr:DUF2786 domain-containing protein [Proteus terrae]MDR9742533.1 DUF2786 domain-containing protein [Proteus terrae]